MSYVQFTSFKPLLAERNTPTQEQLHFPVYASPKIDGIRAIVRHGKLVSRSLKPIPSNHLRLIFGRPEFEAFDGELAVAPGNLANQMQLATSACMSAADPLAFKVNWYIFDHVSTAPFVRRMQKVKDFCDRQQYGQVHNVIQCVPQTLINDWSELQAFEDAMVEQGWEGVMLRSPAGAYKFGRSTMREGILLKMKRFADMEGTIVGFEEEMENANEATIDNLGHTKRSSHVSGMIGKGRLGAIILRLDDVEGTPFKVGETVRVGSGFNAFQRAYFWERRSKLLNSKATFKYQVHGVKDKPRAPIFKSLRHKGDL